MKRMLLAAGLAVLAPLAIVTTGTSPAMAGATAAAPPAAAAPAGSPASSSGSGTSAFNCGTTAVYYSTKQTVPSGQDVAAGVPWYVFSSNAGGCLSSSHVCRTIGSDGTTRAIECADTYADTGNATSEQPVSAFPVASVFCQTISTGQTVQCASMEVQFNLYDGWQDNTALYTYQCGNGSAPCDATGSSTPRNMVIGNGFEFPNQPSDLQENEVWTEIWSVSVRLPGSSDSVGTTSNFGSGHAVVTTTTCYASGEC
jgi:hypothetical protein